MTQFDDNAYSQYDDAKKESNPLGIVGFVFSILCVTSPLGLLISLIALFKNPKGFAIAGTILGIIGTVIIGGVVFLAVAFGMLIFPVIALSIDMSKMKVEIESYVQANQTIPESLDDIGWTGTDPWENDYVYTIDSENQVWTLRILGPDGVAETDDDLVFDSTMDEQANSEAIGAWMEYMIENRP